MNKLIAQTLKPKTESDLVKLLSLLYIQNSKTEDSLLRFYIDQELALVTWESVKSYY